VSLPTNKRGGVRSGFSKTLRQPSLGARGGGYLYDSHCRGGWRKGVRMCLVRDTVLTRRAGHWEPTPHPDPCAVPQGCAYG